jgi:hypothetical protein
MSESWYDKVYETRDGYESTKKLDAEFRRLCELAEKEKADAEFDVAYANYVKGRPGGWASSKEIARHFYELGGEAGVNAVPLTEKVFSCRVIRHDVDWFVDADEIEERGGMLYLYKDAVLVALFSEWIGVVLEDEPVP